MGDDSEWMKLPVNQKCEHKVWKARLHGYEEAIKLFRGIDGEKSPEWDKFQPLIVKFVTDSNAVAQLKGLEAALVYVENAYVAARTAGEVVSGVVCKVFNQPKARARELGADICLMYIEKEKAEAVQENLIKGLENKNPKTVCGCVEALRRALGEFGCKTVGLKAVVKALPRLFESREKAVRDEARGLAVEVYRWIGGALRPALQGVSPVLLRELEEEWARLPATPATQTRFLRSQQHLRDASLQQHQQAEAGPHQADGVGTEQCVPDVDPFELLEPVEILSKLPKDFHDKIEAKKWQDRKEVLEALAGLAKSPRLEVGDYGDVVRALKKVIAKDTNVMLVALAVKCVSGLASGLRKKFSTYAGHVVLTVLEKFKEKKPQVVQALQEAMDAILLTTSLQSLSEDVLAVMDNKNPSVKQQASLFLARSFRASSPSSLPKSLLKPLFAALIKHVNDSAPEVRDAAFDALGSAMRVVGEKAVNPFLADLDKLKVDKIRESAAASGGGEEDKSVSQTGPPTGVPAKTTRPSNQAPAAEPAGGPGKAKPGGAGKRRKPAVPKEPAVPRGLQESELSLEECEELATAVLPASCVQLLGSANWKERLASMEEYLQAVEQMDSSQMPCQALVRMLARKPGWKETNFQVMQLKLRVVEAAARRGVFSRAAAGAVLAVLVERLGDAKCGGSAREALSSVAEACSLAWTAQQVVSMAFAQKSPKSQCEALSWIAGAMKEFGFAGINVQTLIIHIKTALGAPNRAVRTAAVVLLGVVFLYLGPPLRLFFQEEKAALLSQIDAEFQKMQGQSPPAPSRGTPKRPGGQEQEGQEQPEEEQEEEGGAGGLVDLLPRTDISAQISAAMLSKMADKNWKVRKEGLDEVAAVISEAKLILPSLGDLPAALRARLSDSNKILVQQTLSIMQQMASAIGPALKQHIKTLGTPAITVLGDSKVGVRAAARATLSSWEEQTGFRAWLEGEELAAELGRENPFLRQEVLGWLAASLPPLRSAPPDLQLCVPALYACAEDRNPDVRRGAQEALPAFMTHLGFDRMTKAAAKLKPASRDQVVALLEKARVAMAAQAPPAKPTAPPPPAKPAATRPSQPSTRPSLPSSQEPESRAEPRPKAAGKPKVHAGKKAAGKAREEEEQEHSGPMFILLPGGKELRARDEKNLKVLKWSFPSPREEHVEQLKVQMSPCVARWMLEELFHHDFQHHIRAISCMIERLELEKEAMVSCLDLLLKWFTLRFSDTNSSVLMRAVDFLKLLLPCLAHMGYHLNQLEASAFIPYLVLKVGESKDGVRKDVRSILSMLCKVYPASKIFPFLMEGTRSKNSKQRAECLEELGCLVELYGLTVCQPSAPRSLKDIAVHINDRDACVRNAALNTMVAVYNVCGEQIYKLIGHLSDKDMSMLEERIKRSAKKTPPVPSTAPPSKQGEDKAPPPHPNASLLRKPSEQPASKLRQIRAQSAEQQAPPPPAEFSLDVHLLEQSGSPVREMPELYQPSPDHLQTPASMRSFLSRPRPLPVCQEELRPSPAYSINLVISQVASGDLNTSLQALEQMQLALRRPGVMEGLSDQLLQACCLQLRLARSSHLANQRTPPALVTQLCSRLLDCMFTLLGVPSLACEVSVAVLREVVEELLAVLLEPSVALLDQGSVLLEANQVLSLLLERADRTRILSSLLVLMQESLESSSTSKFSELVMKCVWRVIRFLPASVEALDLDQTLLALHNFMMVFTRKRLRGLTSDLPYRTLKTLLHTLYKCTGPQILEHLSLVQDRRASGLETHLKMLLSAGPRDASLYKERHENILKIFNKITSQENCTQGLSELAVFRQHHTEVDLTPHLRALPAPLQTLVQHSLKRTPAAAGGPAPQPSGGEKPKPSEYQESALRPLQESTIQAPLLSISMLCQASQLPTLHQAPPTPAASSLEDLRRKLQRIKENH
ncbi:cytoskeleton-associated protein 5-like isoform X2 [Hypomesus transpacificus]|uniref:cytoskeleton-associated protein 5-like isoform X2 n=1 Tax=Hypomesus transpacificus TaxID=137520 RepID=UPI001F085764|nr:cytoskeleton-associated protein 5-like isoform X2 [Hypomesus transpacificus]